MSSANLQSAVTAINTTDVWDLDPIIDKVDLLMEIERMVRDPKHKLPALKV
jgi:hypothetical protein